MTSYNNFISGFLGAGLIIFYIGIVLTAAAFFTVRAVLLKKMKKELAQYSPESFTDKIGKEKENPQNAEIELFEEPFLFDESVFFNIKYGKISASDEEVTAVAELAGIAHIIDEQSCKNLTKGERQLVAAARAMLFSPKKIVRGEGLSAVDPLTEKELGI
jgi:energy-coupling factor transporter ATP-binding protein EcfA2